MAQSVGLKLIPFSIIDGTLKTYAPNGEIPSRSLKRGRDLETEVNQLITSLKFEPRDGYLEQLYTISRPEQQQFDIEIVYYFLISHKHIFNTREWAEDVGSDERSIISYAVQRLRWKIEYTNIAYSLLPNEFAFGELQRTYEAILGRPMDKRNFRKKIFSLHILADTGKKRVLGRARPAEVYRFIERKLSIVEIL